MAFENVRLPITLNDRILKLRSLIVCSAKIIQTFSLPSQSTPHPGSLRSATHHPIDKILLFHPPLSLDEEWFPSLPFFEKRRRARVRTMIQIKSRKVKEKMRMSKAMMTLDMLPLS